MEEIYLICSPGLAKEVQDAAEAAAYESGIKEVTWVKTGGVITCHGGPGAFGIAGFVKSE